MQVVVYTYIAQFQFLHNQHRTVDILDTVSVTETFAYSDTTH